MAEAVRIEDLQQKISQIIALVKDLKQANSRLREELSEAQNKLEQALASAEKLPEYRGKVERYESERAVIRDKVEAMISELSELEHEGDGIR